ncbi:MAG: DUF952 domain-containing protein [Caldiserica bacterium]|jgi:uncharacterized protein (DUF952 family)|nr:DUF952 domain-containing protein [Caldisericota bacterium]
MIYHIEPEDLWQQALPSGTYVTEGYENDGFIHCSALEQVTDVADRHYHGRHGLLLLCISQKLLDAETLWEPSDGLYYPHIYGPLNASAVVAAVPFPCEGDGTFQLPANIPEDTDDLPAEAEDL